MCWWDRRGEVGLLETIVLSLLCCFCLLSPQEHKPIVLTKHSVDGIQLQGGTILGTSRGGANIK